MEKKLGGLFSMPEINRGGFISIQAMGFKVKGFK